MLVELCAGTASVSRGALGRCVPLTGFMGSKRRWAPLLVEALGCDRPDQVLLVDAGPWGDAWTQLRSAEIRDAVAELLRAWNTRRVEDLWTECVGAAPSTDPVQRVAQYLWLQARSAGTIPVWWSGTRWESPTGSRTEAAHNRGGADLAKRQKGRASRGDGPAYQAGGLERRRRTYAASQVDNTKAGRVDQADPHGRWHAGCRGIQRPATIARRIAALDRIDWSRVEVVHGDVRGVDPLGGGRRVR